MKRLTLGSRNQHKLEEIRAMFDDFPIELEAMPEEFGDVDEDRDTFRGNAVKKALEYAEKTGGPVLADDSGLVVHALDGAPGVYSARFAGEHANHAANNDLLLKKLAGVPKEKRGAEFVTVMVLADPEGVLLCVEGRLRGEIIESLTGKGGFGYDPLFRVNSEDDSEQRTLAEMNADEKNAISHRGRALRKVQVALPLIL
ncbi:MAG: RdgB/HAM1 family non-canonical purine NTP pyrophosphatase [Planctomycetota bacterium]|nr:RdgB/HAM1 family non-canonical purine NTP pyrophosphatase [Planctomycetota bacterium]